MNCEKCKETIYFSKKYSEIILEKFLLIYGINSNYFENGLCIRLNPKMYILFEKLITTIKETDDLDDFRKLTNRIDDDFEVICENCGHTNKVSYSLVFGNEFYFYIDNYIEFIIENTVEKYTGKPIQDFSIYIDSHNYEILYDNLPKEFNKEKQLLKKLYYVRHITPTTFEGGGDGPTILLWLLEQFKIEVFGIILNLIITGGGIKLIVELVKTIKIKSKIRKKIKNKQKYWNDISIEDIKKHISIPKDFKGSKEELIEQILNDKFEEYKSEIIEKLRK